MHVGKMEEQQRRKGRVFRASHLPRNTLMKMLKLPFPPAADDHQGAIVLHPATAMIFSRLNEDLEEILAFFSRGIFNK